MQTRLSKPIWVGKCEICKKRISFSPEPRLESPQDEYTCSCGAFYYINRSSGYCKLVGGTSKVLEFKKKETI